MQKIKDRILLGSIAGFISSGLVMALQQAALRAGWMAKTCVEQAEGATVSHKYLRTKSAAALGLVTSMFVNTFTGVAHTYVLSRTGKDQLLVKSTGLGVLSWLLFHGISTRLTQSFEEDDSPPSSAFGPLLSAVLDNYISGIIIVNLGDDSLFPEPTHQARIKTLESAPGSYSPKGKADLSVNGASGSIYRD
jgi:hypothetical protein